MNDVATRVERTGFYAVPLLGFVVGESEVHIDAGGVVVVARRALGARQLHAPVELARDGSGRGGREHAEDDHCGLRRGPKDREARAGGEVDDEHEQAAAVEQRGDERGRRGAERRDVELQEVEHDQHVAAALLGAPAVQRDPARRRRAMWRATLYTST